MILYVKLMSWGTTPGLWFSNMFPKQFQHITRILNVRTTPELLNVGSRIFVWQIYKFQQTDLSDHLLLVKTCGHLVLKSYLRVVHLRGSARKPTLEIAYLVKEANGFQKLLLLLPTNSMELSCFEKLPVAQLLKNFLTFYENRRFLYHVHKRPQLVSILIQINTVRATPSFFPKTQYNIILSPTQDLPSGLFPSGFPTKFLCAYFFSQWVVHYLPTSPSVTWSM
jgi:hypothetical protein